MQRQKFGKRTCFCKTINVRPRIRNEKSTKTDYTVIGERIFNLCEDNNNLTDCDNVRAEYFFGFVRDESTFHVEFIRNININNALVCRRRFLLHRYKIMSFK